MTTTETLFFTLPTDSMNTNGLREGLYAAEKNREHAWTRYQACEEEDRKLWLDVYGTADGWERTLRRELAARIAIDQRLAAHEPIEWVVHGAVQVQAANEGAAILAAHTALELEVDPPPPFVIPDPSYDALEDNEQVLVCPVCGHPEFNYQEDYWTKRGGGEGNTNVGIRMPAHYDTGDDGGDDDPGLCCESCDTVLDAGPYEIVWT